MAGGLDPQMQRILNNAARTSQEGRGDSFNYSSGEPRTSEWSYAPGPRPLMQDPVQHNGFGQTPFHPPPPSFQAVNANPGPNRLSIPPRNIYTNQEREPRGITNAEHHFKVRETLHQSVPFSQPGPRTGPTTLTDTIGQLATAMLSQQPMGMRKQEEEPVNPFKGLPPSGLNQSQPPKQQITPPFNLSGYAYTPPKHLSEEASSPLAGQNSSPTARISLRREATRPAPPSHYPNLESYSQVERLDPQTPRAHYTTPKYRTPQLALGHAPPMVQGIQLVSPHELPDRFRQVFPYELFNGPQSKCFDPVYKTNENIVVSAPTGSGKTAILELAICKLVEGHSSGQFKIVYQAPTKSLCSERMRDWSKKFSHLNLPCAELTGDTTLTEMARVRNASIIVTTPEKWDSITRKWADHQKLVEMVKLFLIDEVHILKDARGATLEAVVSRMKTMGADVRFVALSATVPNSHDIAVWLGRDHTNQHLPAHRETFGEGFRPVKLQKHVHGFDGAMNNFAFEKVLDGKLPNLIGKYTHNKPIMIFCFTRKSCENTAALLAEWWTRQRPVDRAWSAPLRRTAVGSKELQRLVECGVAFHHAGLDPQDRSAVENGFLKGDINVICCTSTLAVGVNLPCHMVVLKGTVGFQDGLLTEYSDLEVMQMLGRAGRPQFDDSAVAVIMTRSDKVGRYEKMVSGQDVLESTLHLNLIEHLNSEVSLGTIKDSYSAKRWLNGTFLSVRMRQNPQYYKIADISPGSDTDRKLEQICERDLRLLQEHDLVSSEERFKCTQYGEAMSRYMVQFETMKLLLSIPKQAKTEQILHFICQAVEFKDLRMKPQERPFLREFNKSLFIKFPIKENISTTPHKISLMIQVQLGGIELPQEKEFGHIRRQFMTERTIIFERIQRLIRCVIDCKAADCDAISTRHALDLARSLSAEFWEYSNLQLRQIPNVGPVAARKLVDQNINTVEKLASTETATIERYMSKNPPYGKKLKDALEGFPRLHLTAEIVGKTAFKQGQKPEVHVNATLSFGNDKTPVWQGKKPSLIFMAETTEGIMVHFWRGNVTKLDKGYGLKFSVQLSAPEEEIKCWVACEEIVGTVRSCVLRHDIPASLFPPPAPAVKTKNTTPAEKKKAKFEDSDDEFGGNDLGDADLIAAVNSVERGKGAKKTKTTEKGKNVEKGKAVEKSSSDYGSEEFADVDDFDTKPAAEPSRQTTAAKKAKTPREPPEFLEPIQMANGKWKCLHTCRDGGLLKNGNKCKHQCCREGLDKAPKKQKPRKSSAAEDAPSVQKENSSETKNSKKPTYKSKPKFELPSDSDDDIQNVEVVDLAKEMSPVGYEKLAPSDYRKLYSLHTSFQKDKDETVRLPKQQPKFAYGSGVEPVLSFMTGTEGATFGGGGDETGDEDFEFPAASQLAAHTQTQTPKQSNQLGDIDILDAEAEADAEADLFADCSFEYEDQTYVSPNEATANSLHSGISPSQAPASTLEQLEIEIDSLPRSEPRKQREASPLPKVNSSFANRIFDFEEFGEGDVGAGIFDELEDLVSPLPARKDSSLKSGGGSGGAKRERSLSPGPSPEERKCRRVSKDEVVPVVKTRPALPEWTSEIDKSLIDELRDFVDFV